MEYTFPVEVTAVSHREPADDGAAKKWRGNVELHVQRTLLYNTSSGYSAIVRLPQKQSSIEERIEEIRRTLLMVGAAPPPKGEPPS